MKHLLAEAPQYKVNMHAHTTVSDGALSPQELKSLYKSEGYHAVLFSDHEILMPHEDLCDENFIALHGYEYGIADEKEHKRLHRYYHFNLIARRQDMRTQVLFRPDAVIGRGCAFIPRVRYYGELAQSSYSAAFVNRLIREAHEAGFLVQYNHPNWSLQTALDYADLQGVDLLEVINFGSSAMGSIPERDDKVLGEFLSFGHPVFPTGGDDNHNEYPAGSEKWDSFGGYTVLAAKNFSYEGLIGALEKGDGYATEGPRIYALTADDKGKITAVVSGGLSVTVRGAGRFIEKPKTVSVEKDVCVLQFNFADQWQYFRLALEDEAGRRGYTRAYFAKEIFS